MRPASQLDREGWPREHQTTAGDNRGRAQPQTYLDGEELARAGFLRLSLCHPCRFSFVAHRDH